MKISLLSRRRQGFTLVEVLVSSALTLIVLGMLFSVLLGTMNAWDGGTARLQTNADARLALDLIARDLQSMVVRQTPYNQQWLASYPVAITSSSDSGGKWALKNAAPNTTSLTFFAPSIDRDSGQEGDIVAISYRSGYQDPFSESNFVPMHGLYKTMIDTTNTFTQALGQSNIIGGFWQAQTGVRDPLSRLGFLVPNAIEFKVAWWVRSNANPTLDPIRIEADRVLSLGNQLTVDGAVLDGKIEAADISITLLTDEGMRIARLVNNDWTRLQAVIREHGRVHSQRVVIQY